MPVPFYFSEKNLFQPFFLWKKLFSGFLWKCINFVFFFLNRFLSVHHVLNWAGLSAHLYIFCLGAGINAPSSACREMSQRLTRAPSQLLPKTLTSLKECRDLPHFKSEIGNKKNLFLSKNLFLALKSEIANKKKIFLMIKLFFF